MVKKEVATEIAQRLAKSYPTPVTELVYDGDYQLTVAVMLSAQTTDKKVNQITPKLFKKYPSWEDLSSAELIELQKDIYGVNFHKGKADRLIKAASVVLKEFKGKLPNTLGKLVKIPGIARKSANVILNELWDITEGIVVDTHVTRVSNRLGLTTHTNAVKIEQDLMRTFDKKYWSNLSGSIVLHGRYVCKAKKPDCANCMLNDICPSAFAC